MKRHGNLWDKITALDNIAAAHKAARRGKTFYSEVKMVDANPEWFFAEIQHMLVSKQFTTSEYEVEERFDGRKLRTIHKLPYYPDRIIQHALLSVVGPILTQTLIRDTFQSITGRGTSDAAKRVKKLVRSSDCPAFALKMDIAKYYPNVNNDLLKTAIQRKIKCKDTLWLIDDVIDSTKGLPIGNYTSQIFGNINLNRLDWMVKQQIKPAGYFRYCDDILVMANSTSELMEHKSVIVCELERLGLFIKPDWSISKIRNDGVDFVGYVFRPESTRLRDSIASNFKQTCRRAKKHGCKLNSLMAYKGWVKRASAKRLWRKHTNPLSHIFPKQVRSAV